MIDTNFYQKCTPPQGISDCAGHRNEEISKAQKTSPLADSSRAYPEEVDVRKHADDCS